MIKKLPLVALSVFIMLSALVVSPLSSVSANHGPDDDWDRRFSFYTVAHGWVLCKIQVIDQGVGSNSYFQSRFWDNGCHIQEGQPNAGQQVFYGYVWRHSYVLRKPGFSQYVSGYVQPAVAGYHEFTNTAYTPYYGGDIETLVALCDTFTGGCTYPYEL